MAELSKRYDPKAVEPKWYQRWIDDRDFVANSKSSKPPFSIVMPPPNITGVLTLGHVLNNTIQDILARRARMQGFEVLWLPGMDHAGIGTQTAVEKYLRRTENKTRHDLGREEFLRRVLEWQDKHGGIIIEQLKRLGCSCDWSRQRYTLDEAYARAVQKVFVDLYNKGLIYRGRRMINWDPAAQTALSDEEVITKPQKGNLYFVRYEIVEEPGRFLEVATTRPETIMADTGDGFSSKRQAIRRLVRQTRMASTRARENSHHRRRSDRSGIRHGRSKSHAGARYRRFRDRPAPRPADYRCSDSGRTHQLSDRTGVARTRSIRSAKKSGGVIAGEGSAGQNRAV